MKYPLVALAVLLVVVESTAAAQWTPAFETRPGANVVAVGQTFTVDFHVSNVQAATTGYQSDIIYDPADAALLSITQGPYLQFQTFFGSTVVAGRARIGALNFPVPTALPPGTGAGVLATATFRARRAGPISLDMRQPSILVSPQGQSIRGTTVDALVYASAPSDILAVFGQPNPGGSILMDVTDATNEGRTVISAASFGNAGISVGVGTIPLNLDPLLFLAVLNVPPYVDSVTTISAGRARSGLQLSGSPATIGLRLYFASVILDRTNDVARISNGTSVMIIDA